MFATIRNIRAAQSRSIITRAATIGSLSAMLWVVFLPVSALALDTKVSTSITNKDTVVTSSEVKSALSKTADVLDASDQTKTTSDANSAIKAATAGSTVDIPKNAAKGVTLGASNNNMPNINISLPNVSQGQSASQIAPGTVAYAGINGSANAVQATEDGGVRMLTVIDNPHAPTAYDYKVTVPNGGHLDLLRTAGQ
jgi:hypothetical protein